MTEISDAELAARLAVAAGDILLAVRASGLLHDAGLGKAGDRTANAFLMQALAERRPDDAVLSEESADDKVRLTRSRVWIIDPLDGTREYGEGRTDWAVHVGLAVDGCAMVGAVALPGLGLVQRSDQPPPLPSIGRRLRMLVSRSRPAAEALAVAKAMDADLAPMGSAGAKAMAVVRGEADIYLHSGGQYEWDNCAPVAVAQAAGLHVTRLDGSPMRYNAENTWLPDLLICRPELATQARAAIARL
ncbi:MAG: 3'(2'),5'-bisphosphate nucleotidase CysQ [Phenylobacterium sp.]|uniref:3'(2'),5'-bisphosphate nucleotidase CysQ n=1 Tax=Phenylobacterium sp. TaxID=1871053 RepID=UPI0027348C14|nr:3'(2'),5'-bisphosphate nucleotidase CysQ [Phenylobacterium sp.]MDP3175796.1 3'(2'),5'-bisphosphate nucleotidase CysQ [Phenylobacterium sp.]